uniref:Retrovirus-related Pol polyprotein from transposon TNT 1-94 n=1 Tax=Tanacetum cinerariifolium TaxID=118510 RepID=A0A6L2J5L8_TANCI|nr:retrovirus-related Pol polyprotein from transposon TNT 1-94 [Tanacetum cinerariifolium]
MNMSLANKAHFEAEKEAIHLILTRIGDEIYSTVDACQTAQEMWEAIEGLQQGETLNIQDVKTNLFWEFCKFTSHDGETMESYYTRFYKLMNKMIRNNLTIAMILARNANPLAFVATAQANQDPYYQTSKSHKSHAPSSKPSILTRSHTNTRYKGKEIAKPITPPSEIASEEDSDPEQAQRDKDMQKNLALIAKYFKKIYKPTNNNLRTSSNSRNKNVDTTLRENVGSPVVKQYGIQCFKCKEFGHFAKEYRKPKKVKDSAYHKEKMLLCKQAEQELEAHYSYMAKIQEVPIADTCTESKPLEHVQNEAGYNVFTNDLQHSEQFESVSNTCLVEMDDSNVIPIQKQLRKANTTLAQELKECKTVLAETSKTLRESISVRDSCLVALQNKQTEFEKYKEFNDRTIDYDKLKRKGKSVDTKFDNTKFDKPSAVRQPKAQQIPKPSVLGINHKTNVSRPQHKSNQLKDKVMPNNSQVKLKKTQVEVHPRIASISNKMKSVTACNDSLNSRTLNANHVCATCKKCLVDSNHFACVTKMLNDVNARTKKPNVVPISTRKPKGHANKSVATLHKKKVASKSTNQKPQSYYRMLYEKTNLEVAFWKSTCFVRDLKGNDLLIGNRGSDIYTISLQESTSSTPLCLMAKASPTQAWLWHRRSSHLNFDYINLLSKKDVVIGLPKLKYVKDQLCSSCELSKAKRSPFKSKAIPSLKRSLNLLHIDLCGPMRVASINGKKYILSKGYSVYNKRTRMTVESIHIRFDEFKEVSDTSVANDTSGLVPQR